jgi:hypothetical protein
MLRLDQRTGRLEKAIHLYEDGVRPGMMTREPDRPHPQSRSTGPVFDRAMLKIPKREFEKGSFTFTPGLWGNSDLTRNDVPGLSLGVGNGVVQYSITAGGGYSYATLAQGFGHFAYGGFEDDATEVKFDG